MQKNKCEICIIDSLKIITKEGYTNLCMDYGKIKQIVLHQYDDENKAVIEYADKESVKQFLKKKSNLPSFLKVIYSNEININDSDNEDIGKFKVTGYQEKINKEDIVIDSIIFGPKVFGSEILQESKQLKLINDQKQLYNLRNDDLFGKPLNTKWEKMKKLEFQLHNIDFCRFENCFGGEIKIEKKLGPNVFTGWPTLFDGQNVQDKLKDISSDIESSELLNINSLERGMLVGVFDIATNSYARGYVVLISGNSVNVAMSDYGRVINTIQIRALPEKLTQLPAYSFKVFTKDNCVSKLKEKLIFKVSSASINRIKLIIFDENKEIQVQLKKWTPTVEESGVPCIELKNDSDVELINLKNMNSVYLRSKQLDDIDILFSTWNSVVAHCQKNSHSLKREPYYGEIIGFKSIITTNYERGRIHKYFGDNVYYVKHMHHPIKESIELSEMIELQFEHKSMPLSFITVGLTNALPYPIIDDAEGFVECLKNTRLVVHFDESSVEGWKCLDLTIKCVKENVNVILNGLVEPSWLKNIPKNSVDNIYYKSLLRMNLKKKSVVHMKFVMYHSGVYYMRDKLFGKSFSLLSSMIKEYSGLNLHPYLPQIDEVCLGQFPDGMWYRVVCNQLKGGHLTGVHSVDLGNVALLKSIHMKEMPVEFLFHPIHVYQCILAPSIIIDANKLKILQQYENTDCEVTIVNNDENYYLIKCPFIENILR